MRKILIIDDSPNVCTLLTMILDKKSHVISCTTIEDAHEKIAKDSFDFIISDISIPSQDGDDFILDHREFVGSAHVVFISANHEERLIQAQSKLLECGLKKVSWLQKPILVKDLLAIIK